MILGIIETVLLQARTEANNMNVFVVGIIRSYWAVTYLFRLLDMHPLESVATVHTGFLNGLSRGRCGIGVGHRLRGNCGHCMSSPPPPAACDGFSAWYKYRENRCTFCRPGRKETETVSLQPFTSEFNWKLYLFSTVSDWTKYQYKVALLNRYYLAVCVLEHKRADTVVCSRSFHI